MPQKMIEKSRLPKTYQFRLWNSCRFVSKLYQSFAQTLFQTASPPAQFNIASYSDEYMNVVRHQHIASDCNVK